MQLLSAISFGLVLSSTATAKLVELNKRDSAPACVGDNLLRCFTNSRALATAFCTQTLGATTVTVATTVATSTTVATITLTGESPSETPSNNAIAKRVTSVSADVPACVSGAYTYAASRITSACACIGITQSTVSATYTVSTATVTSTKTAYVPPSVSSSSSASSTTTASPSNAACISNPAFVNGDFESGNLNGWQTVQTVNPAGLILDTGTQGANGSQHALHIFTNFYNSQAAQSVQEGTYLATVPGVTYKLSFRVNQGGWSTWAVSVNGITLVTDYKVDTPYTEYSGTFVAQGQDLVVVSCSSGDWQYAEWWFDNFAAMPVSN